MKHRLTLDYSLGRGGLAPYLDAIAGGVALAGVCSLCGRTTFPPERRCRCEQYGDADATPGHKQLSGHAQIVFRTDGPAGHFALVRFEGADNQTVCRIANPDVSSNTAKLAACDEGKPGIVVQMAGDKIESNG